MGLGDEVDRIKAERADAQRQAAADAERAMQHWHDELRELWSDVEDYCRERGLRLPTYEVRTYTPRRDWLGRSKRDGSHDEHIAHETGLPLGDIFIVPPGRLLVKDGEVWTKVEPLGREHGVVARIDGFLGKSFIFACGPDGPITSEHSSLRQSIIEALASM